MGINFCDVARVFAYRQQLLIYFLDSYYWKINVVLCRFILMKFLCVDHLLLAEKLLHLKNQVFYVK